MSSVDRKTWEEFRNSKLLWWVNRSLHLFGWAIVCTLEEDGTISEVYPARVKFRGFSPEIEESNFILLSEYIAKNSEEFYSEILDD